MSGYYSSVKLECVNKNSVDSQGTFSLGFTVPKDIPYFDGHFPGQPIMPAVTIVDITYQFLKGKINFEIETEKSKLNFLSSHVEDWSIESGKFLHPVRPLDRVQMKVKLKNEETQLWSIEWMLLESPTNANQITSNSTTPNEGDKKETILAKLEFKRLPVGVPNSKHALG